MNLTAVTSLVALGFALLPATAVAAPVPNVAFTGTITVPVEPGGSHYITNTGTWTASGFVSGTFDVSEKTWFGSGTVHDVSTLTAAGGTITVDVQGRFVSFTAVSAHVQGVWAITGGTGAYANLSGNGDYDATIDRSVQPRIVTESLTGVAEGGASN
ncbi:MAG TPA: hypothetical protein VF838_11920 [Trebonia sp.]